MAPNLKNPVIEFHKKFFTNGIHGSRSRDSFCGKPFATKAILAPTPPLLCHNLIKDVPLLKEAPDPGAHAV